MNRPVIGILGNRFLLNDRYPVQVAGEMYMDAIAEIIGATPLIIPSMPKAQDVGALLDVCHGIILTGGRPNVHPSHYGHEETEAHGPFDLDRDALALGLSTAYSSQSSTLKSRWNHMAWSRLAICSFEKSDTMPCGSSAVVSRL